MVMEQNTVEPVAKELTPAQKAWETRRAKQAKSNNPGPAPRTWADFKKHPLVVDTSDERGSGDGLLVYLVAGWVNTALETHMLHEDTVAELRKEWRSIERCECDECKRLIARGEKG